MLTQRVAEEVRALMARRRISQEVAAQAIGRSQSYMSRRAKGEMPFDVTDLERLAKLLDVPVTQLLPRLDSNQEPAGYGRHLALVA